MARYLYVLSMLLSHTLCGQVGILSGKVTDRITREPLVGVSVVLDGTDPLVGVSSDVNGQFRLTAPAGSYTVKATAVGYQAQAKYNIVLTSGNLNVLNFEMEEEQTTLGEVVVREGRSAAVATLQSPLSIQRLTSEEIRSNPGGNFDISRVIQSLPGVSGATGSAGFRNDIIIRGGAPNENVFYLDGIEIPVINHFTTQGSSGGPQGILNVSFIEDVTLSTSAFGAQYDNALSSVFQFKQRTGNPERVQGNLRLSGTELALTFDGPLSKKTTFLASARRSYLQYFFQLIDLPIRPKYWDFQFKVTHQLSASTTLTAIGVGAIDEFSFAVPRESTPEKEAAIRSNPAINQDMYTVGMSLNHSIKNGSVNVALSRNYFNNRLDKFDDEFAGGNRTQSLDANSDEIENKLRLEVKRSVGEWRYSYGIMAQYVQFNNRFFSVIRKEIRDEADNIVQPSLTVNFQTKLDFVRYGAFIQASRLLFNNRLSISPGLRADGDSFTTAGGNPFNTLSPRVALSYAIDDRWNWNASWGRYYKIPIYTVLGFQNADAEFVNRDNDYIRSQHYVTGIEFLPDESLRFTVETFYKQYANYPVSVRDGISLANFGSEFGAIGNEAFVSNGRGRTYGFEFFVQKKLTHNTFYVLSYTWYKSEFSGNDGRYVASAWDNRNLISVLLGQKFKRGWEIGMKYRHLGGAPYTPLDLEASRINYLSVGRGIEDFSRLNEQRLSPFNQFDFRIDKKWNLRRVTIDLFLDVQNALLFRQPQIPQYAFDRNSDRTYRTTDGQPIRADGGNAIPVFLEDDDPFVLPTLGFIIEF